MRLAIRKANSRDAGHIAALIREAFTDVARQFSITRKNCPTHPSNCTREWIVGDLEKGKTYFLADDGVLRGCAGLDVVSARTGTLMRLCVLPRYRCRGIGEALLQAVESEALSRGLTYLEIGIIAEHDALRAWYQKRGFRAVARKNYRHLPFVVLSMAKELACP